MRRVVLTLAALSALAAGCGQHAARPTAQTAAPSFSQPQAVSSCGAVRKHWRPLRNVGVDAAILGTGPTVIFANDSGNDPCDWISLAEQLAANGHCVAVFTYSDPSAAAEPFATRETLAVAKAAAAGNRFALVGASLGGRVVIEAAARHPPRLAAM